MASFARRAMSLAQIPSVRAASVAQRRGLAGAADHHGSTKVDFWKQPTNPGNWKEEQFVLISMSGWGLLFYSGYKLFTGKKKRRSLWRLHNEFHFSPERHFMKRDLILMHLLSVLSSCD